MPLPLLRRSAAPRPRRLLTLAALVGVTLLAAACSGTSDVGGQRTSDGSAGGSPSTTGAPAEAFPVTIPHAFGGTEVSRPPTRVVTWGWGSADAAIALGVVPVAIPFQSYGGDQQGVLPWVREALEKQSASVPVVLPNAQEPPFEAIAAARPDLILAVYSGITDNDYRLLSQIAPTVAYPHTPWATPWRDTITTVGKALGRGPQAEQLLAEIDDKVEQKAEAHPELAGKSVAAVAASDGKLYVYKPADPRVAFLVDLGLLGADSVDRLAGGTESFYYELSAERLPDLESDVLVSYADTPETSQSFRSTPSAQLMDQVKRGAVAEVVGTALVASVSPPTALSLTWGLDEYLAILSSAAKAADQTG